MTDSIVETKLIYTTEKGSEVKAPCTLQYKDNRIWFLKSPFGMKDEIKAMGGSRWHGFETPKQMCWSVDDSFRNQFQLNWMMGENVYKWFERPLIEHTYREYMRNGLPASPMLHQVDMANHGLSYHFQIWGAEMGTGKGGLPSTKIATPTGWTTLGEVSVGDEVIDSTGGTTRLKGVFPRGKMEMFRVTFTDDSSTVCSGDHLWKVRTSDNLPYETLSLSEIIDQGTLNYCIPMVAPVSYPEQPLEIDPHQMGLLAWDDSIKVTEEYLFNTVAKRIDLLQGLCDADGYNVETGGVEFCATSTRHFDLFVTLVQSLGGTCHYNDDETFTVYASLPSDIVPFRLSRKVEQYKPTIPTRAIVSVESIGEHECICVAVEADNQLYVTDEYIVTHNTLSAQMVIENADVDYWYWIGPKTSLPNIQREFNMWGFDPTCATIESMTYERLVRVMDDWKEGDILPQGVIFDESSRCKTYTSQRSKAAQKLTDLMRSKYMWDAYVILMSGTPSPKKPTDWWKQCEIAWPGFLREGSVKALEQRLAFQVQKKFDSGTFWTTVGWRDDDKKCSVCGKRYDEGDHELDLCGEVEYHEFVAAKNEVSYMFERLKGLALIKHKKDCLTLPDKRYRKVMCKPSQSLLRVAKTIVDSAPNQMVGMTKLRELSDGFQYREVADGTKDCNHCTDGTVIEWFDPENELKVYQAIDMLDEERVAELEHRKITCPKCQGTQQMRKTKRITKLVPCPKEKALKGLLGECEETGRIVIFAGFTGSVDRCVNICHNEGWAVVRCDGRGFQITQSDGATVTAIEALDFWADMENHEVAFVAHPESGGMSLTLTESRMAVYWSNSFKPEYRVQSEDRIHRKGMDENLGCSIVDLIHLPTDERVVDIIRDNRKLELMTMGKITDGIDWEGSVT